MTKKRYEEIIKRLRYWDVVEGHTDPITGEHVSQEELRKSCETSWFTTNRFRYKLEPISMASDEPPVEHLQYLVGREGIWRVVVHEEMVFDAIRFCHVTVRHKKVTATRTLASLKYYNLTEDLCRIYIETCPLCNTISNCGFGTQPNVQESRFRERFTACLVDYTINPVTDVNGVTMQYVLVLQDEATKFTVLRPIRGTDPAVLRYELSFMFGVLGYPKKCFTVEEESYWQSNLIKGLFQRRETSCYIEEDSNDLTYELRSQVKQVISDLVAAEEKDDSAKIGKVNWTSLIPAAMTAINNLSYPKVFGMEFSSRKVEQEGTQGQQHVILHHDITDANISLEKEDVPEVNMVVGEASPSECLTVGNEKQAPETRNDKVPKEPVDCIDLALQDPRCEVVCVDAQNFRVVYPQLRCQRCDELTVYGKRILSVPVASYFDSFDGGTRWWTIDMIKTFAILKSHEKHHDHIIFVDSGTPTRKEYQKNTNIRVLPASITTILTLAIKQNHFVVLQIRLDQNTTVVYDGKADMKHKGLFMKDKGLEQWEEHEEYVLSRYGISKQNSRMRWIMRHHQPLKDFRRLLNIKQRDDHSCGPIACRVLWELLSPGEVDEKYGEDRGSGKRRFASDDIYKWRNMCATELKSMIRQYARDMLIPTRKKKGDEDEEGTKTIHEEAPQAKHRKTK